MQQFGTVGKSDWGTRPVFIVGGGPSLKPFASKLWLLYQKGWVVAVNDSYKNCFFPDAIVSLDHLWLSKNLEKYKTFKHFPGPVFVAVEDGNNPRVDSENLTYLQRPPRKEFDPNKNKLSNDPGKITNGMNSGYAALNFCYLKGAKTVFLLGFDFKEIKNQTHWHSGYSWQNRLATNNLFSMWAGAMDETAAQLNDAGVWVFNCSPDSLLKAFPHKSYEEALGN